MKVLVTGANGQLGFEIINVLNENNVHFVSTTSSNMDITSLENVRKKLTEVKPDIIIHTAAYTQVDLAESNANDAYQINAVGTRNLARIAEEIGVTLCYISTDYVFDGQSNVPYKETDPTNPLGVYGKSKYQGESFVRSICSKFFIVRTSWLYGNSGKNFIKTMLRLSEEKREIGVVNDQIGSPTYARDLAIFLLELVQTEKYGIYHASNSGFCSWYDFACAIFDEVDKEMVVHPLTTAEYKTPAKRPSYSVLDNEAIRINGLTPLRNWKDALHEFIKEYGG